MAPIKLGGILSNGIYPPCICDITFERVFHVAFFFVTTFFVIIRLQRYKIFLIQRIFSFQNPCFFFLIAILLSSYRGQCTMLPLTGCIPGENKGWNRIGFVWFTTSFLCTSKDIKQMFYVHSIFYLSSMEMGFAVANNLCRNEHLIL